MTVAVLAYFVLQGRYYWSEKFRRGFIHPVRHQNAASFSGHMRSTVLLMCCAIIPAAPSWGGNMTVTTTH